MAKENPVPTEAPKAAEIYTPEELAKLTGNVKALPEEARIGGAPGVTQLFSWQHAAAAQLHGWNAHALHTADPFKLARSDYEKALEAACAPDETGRYRAHARALSPYVPKEL